MYSSSSFPKVIYYMIIVQYENQDIDIGVICV